MYTTFKDKTFTVLYIHITRLVSLKRLVCEKVKKYNKNARDRYTRRK